MAYKRWDKCELLTLEDNFRCFLLSCIKLNKNDGDHVWAILEATFREYGLLDYMRNDNGPPFATSGVGRISYVRCPEAIDSSTPFGRGMLPWSFRSLMSFWSFRSFSFES